MNWASPVLDELRSRHQAGRVVRWLDLCRGTANALFEAADQLGDQAEIVGVDLGDHSPLGRGGVGAAGAATGTDRPTRGGIPDPVGT